MVNRRYKLMLSCSALPQLSRLSRSPGRIWNIISSGKIPRIYVACHQGVWKGSNTNFAPGKRAGHPPCFVLTRVLREAARCSFQYSRKYQDLVSSLRQEKDAANCQTNTVADDKVDEGDDSMDLMSVSVLYIIVHRTYYIQAVRRIP